MCRGTCGISATTSLSQLPNLLILVDALEDELDGVDQPKPSGGATASPSTGPSDLPRDSAQPSTPSMPPRNTLTLPPTPIPAVKTAPLFNLSRLPQRGRPAIAPAQRAPLVIVKKMAAARPVLNGTHPIPRNDQAAAGNGAAQSVPKTGEPAPQAPNSTQMAQPVVNGAHPPSNYAQPAHPTTTAAALPELKNAEPAQRPVGAVQPIMKRAEPTQPVSTAAHPTSTRAVAAPQEFGQRAFTSDRQPVSVVSGRFCGLCSDMECTHRPQDSRPLGGYTCPLGNFIYLGNIPLTYLFCLPP